MALDIYHSLICCLTCDWSWAQEIAIVCACKVLRTHMWLVEQAGWFFAGTRTPRSIASRWSLHELATESSFPQHETFQRTLSGQPTHRLAIGDDAMIASRNTVHARLRCRSKCPGTPFDWSADNGTPPERELSCPESLLALPEGVRRHLPGILIPRDPNRSSRVYYSRKGRELCEPSL